VEAGIETLALDRNVGSPDPGAQLGLRGSCEVLPGNRTGNCWVGFAEGRGTERWGWGSRRHIQMDSSFLMMG
jgi:hypothetical protein